MKNYCVILVLLILVICANAQTENTIKIKKNKLSSFPVIFYAPETRLAAGIFGSYTFYNKKDSTQKYPSQIQIGAAYTLNKQLLLFFPFRVYTKQNKYAIYGEAGYYKYSYFFYGIGNNQATNYKELYRVNFPRVKINFLKQLKPNLFVGLRYWLENYKLKGIENNQQLDTANITGVPNNFISGIGPAFNYDTRDNIFYPIKGVFIDGGVQFYGKELGSNFKYSRYNLDASMYFANHNSNVFAFNLFADFLMGNQIPFNQLAMLGGNKKMRGYYEGRFRDKNLISLCTEYRFGIYKRFGGVFFANAGAVNSNLNNIAAHIQTSVGTGARFTLNKAEKLNIRFDVGFGKKSTGFYFTIGEAF